MTDLALYDSDVHQIKKYAKEHNISEEEVNLIFKKCLKQLEKEQFGKLRITFVIIKVSLTMLLITFISTIGLYNHSATHNLLLRNMQHFIYPGLRIFRKLAVPVITKYSSLTDLYDEWCLIENPYFHISDMDCWPCSSIVSVPNLTDYNITKSFNIGIPFTRMENSNEICFKNLYEIYMAEQDIFHHDARRIVSNNVSYRTIRDFMQNRIDLFPSLHQNIHVTWRVTRINSGRILRNVFSTIIGIPDWWGQSTERFVFIDEAKAPIYYLPNPECSNIILQCASGARLIRLIPSSECTQSCKTSTVLLSAGHSLWYNWWYWRPISLPAENQTTISINYLTSYC